ncbi:MAG: MT-A70 family methyltransferase [Bradyrhizobium sp.]|uniref:MT-A70 family methyltransferase n=1 Tax=Bradyrhizobium sp. TaxID=376 RepID=UPI00272F279B|nr:MT-A70 family methyltransferase [Bradyrhizobium sp.]MDP1866969.1 MT-A70 family methyltransferase [Bradyrhizobium sp.]
MNGHLQPGGLLMPGAARPKHHPLANLFPMLGEDRRESFRNSLAEGQNHPIVLHKGMLLDGRNRERELFELNKPIAFRVFVGTDRQALDFVKAENLERRDLTESQRAMVAAKIATLRLGDNQHTAAPIGAPSLFAPPEPDAAEPDAEPARISQCDAADMMNVSRRNVQRATVVQDKGAPELVVAVEQGRIAVSAAAEIAALPVEEQKAIIAAADPKVVKEIAKKNRAEKSTAGRERRLANMAKRDVTPLLDGGARVGVFYVDIPREFSAWSDQTGTDKAPEMHYRVEKFQFLADMRERILARAEENSVMFMWAWANSLQDQIDLMTEWGFAARRQCGPDGRLLRDPDGRILPPVGEGRYRSHQIWAKRSANGNLHQGMGFWFRDCHEVLLVGARGDVPAPLPGTQATSVIDALIGAHSEKPNEAFRDQIDRYFPGVRKLELFGRTDDLPAFRKRWPEWEIIGNDVAAASPQGDVGTGATPSSSPVLETMEAAG